MPKFMIILGNKAYSSWSLRCWLLVKRSGAAFEEEVVLLDRPGFKAEILAHSPSGRVPVLKAGGLTIWDSHTTDIRVRVGFFGDEPLSRLILDKMRERLRLRILP